MRPDGILTTVDTEAEHQRLAKQAFAEAGIASQRVRLIPGPALDVVPRLTDGHYDMVFCDADKQEYPAYLDEALRLLRPGGVVAFDNALWHDRVADPAQRDQETVAIRELGNTVRDHDSLVPVLLPVGDGLLVAKKVWTPGLSQRRADALRPTARPRTPRSAGGADDLDRRLGAECSRSVVDEDVAALEPLPGRIRQV